MAKVSIIIPTYNVEDYLHECMESVTRQTLKDIEIICINDGSTDNSLSILKEYAEKDSRIVIVDKKNEGYGIGMNIGLDKANGEYIGIVEPDDYVAYTMFEDLYNIASKNDLDFVKADFYRFTRAENDDMNMVYNHLSSDKSRYNVVFDPSNDPSALMFIMNTWSGIYKREFLNSRGIRHNTTGGASYQDNGFWFQTFCYAKRAMIIDRPYYRNRRDNPNSSVHNKQKVYCMNIEYDHIRDLLMRDPEVWQKFKYMYSLRRYHNYIATLNRIGDEFKEEYCIRFATEYKRSRDLDELDPELFTHIEWDRLKHLMRDPRAFAKGRASKGTDQESVELWYIKNSTTYKVGKLIMYIPCRLKEFLKKIMGRG